MKYKNLILIMIISIIIYFIYSASSLYINIFNILKQILIPILLSFFFAFSFYPIYKLLNKKINKYLSLFIILINVLFILFILIYYSFPLIYDEFIILIDYFNIKIINYIYDYININFITKSINLFTNFIFILFLTFYFLFYFDKIILFIKNFFKDKYHLLLSNIYNDLNNYFKGFYLLMFIEIIEYLVIYYLIGHPLFLILAILSGLTSIIPYIGALFTNLIALITALSISKELFIASAIAMIVIPILNNYFVEVKIYSNKVQLPVLGIILSMVIFSAIFDIYGVIFCIPMYIIFKNIFNFLYLLNNH